MAKDGFQYFHRPEKEKKTAVALEYEPTDQAPKVIASGQGYVAEKIIQTAREADIPVHRDEKLAGSLREIEIGEYIPPELYQVVDRKSTRLNSSHVRTSRMPSSA